MPDPPFRDSLYATRPTRRYGTGLGIGCQASIHPMTIDGARALGWEEPRILALTFITSNVLKVRGQEMMARKCARMKATTSGTIIQGCVPRLPPMIPG